TQRRLEDKQPEEKTNTDCLVKEQEKEYQTWWKIKTGNVLDSCNQRSTQQYKKSRIAKHLGVAGIQQQNRLVDETNVTFFAKGTLLDRVLCRRLEDKQPEEKTNTDCLVKEQEKEYQTWWKIKTGNVLDSCNQRSTQQYKKSRIAKHLGVAGIQQQNRLVDETNVTFFAKHMEALSTTKAGYMTFTEAWKKKMWLKGLLTESRYELRLVAGTDVASPNVRTSWDYNYTLKRTYDANIVWLFSGLSLDRFSGRAGKLTTVAAMANASFDVPVN
nr:hypothetical protein [Tanacetum cinerariifolium]